MRSTFMGLEASKRGLFVQQSALYTTGHNISNANTLGYSRQRVNMQATSGYPYPGLNSPQYPGHMGTGVEASSVQRMRDEFTDRQFRQETNKLGYWDSTLKSINQMEDVLSEPSEFGINQSFTEFWKSFQDLSKDPTDSAARKVVVARGESLAEAFNYNYTQLETIQGNLGNEIAVSTQQINTILEKIAMINDQVKTLEPNGYVTNDLYDARDVLIDELNEYLPVSIERVPSGGRASEVAEGSLTVKYNFTDNAGQRQSIVLVNGKDFASLSVNGLNNQQINGSLPANYFNNITVTDPNSSGKVGLVTPGTPPSYGPGNVTYNNFESSRGKLIALIDSYGYAQRDATGNLVMQPSGTDPVIKGTYPEMMADLNLVAKTFVEVFNEAHALGYTLDGSTASTNGGAFFTVSTTDPAAKTMKVSDDLIKDPNLVAASSRKGEEGNGRWAMELSNLQYKKITENYTFTNTFDPNPAPSTPPTLPRPNHLGGFTFQDFYTGMVGDLAVMGDKAITNQFNSQTQMITVSNARSSMNSVSLDEEMTNMITFQQAYNANARMITVVDETLDKIINGMGRVGL
ncbi:flagellar hook-associated protein FlgK [Lysinibacillus sp. KU-BSD001]|uniref:flagellar hook-associated protein FlgK n=1 Tax=Lysinibacillus sp. KU-BSD001 TaxID=3141328 RepID=UPI0036EDECD2